MRLALEYGVSQRPDRARWMMRCCVLDSPYVVRMEERLVPQAGPREATVQVKLATICAADCLIARGEYPVRPGLVLGHEGVGIIHELGTQVAGLDLGDRVLIHAVPRGEKPMEPCNGWCLGHTIDGTQAEFVRVPDAETYLTLIPRFVSDQEALLSHMAANLSRDPSRRYLFDEIEIAYRTLLPWHGRCPKMLVEVS